MFDVVLKSVELPAFEQKKQSVVLGKMDRCCNEPPMLHR